jgi:hypothetical protein
MNVIQKCGLIGLLTVLLSGMAVAQFQQGIDQQTPQAQQGQQARITKGPVIDYADDQFAVVAWTTDVPTDSRVYYGEDVNNLTQVAEGPSNTTAHRVHISNLRPSFKYFFQIDNGQAGTPGQPTDSFETVATGAPPLRNQTPTRVANAAAQGATVTRGPSIQYADDRSAVISWTTDKPAPNVVYYGNAESNLSQTAEGATASTEHRVHLSNLMPGTKYFFQVDTGQAPGATMATYNFQTVAAGDSPIYDRMAAQGNAEPVLQQRPQENIYKGGLLVPAGTEVHATLDSSLSSKSSKVGDQFTASITQPVMSQNGTVAIPAGAKIRGEISNIEQGKVLASVRGKARMDMRFTEVILPNGASLPLTATLLGVGGKGGANTNQEGGVTDKTQGKEVAKDVGIGAGLGTVAGLIFGSALKGLAIGAIAGGGYVLATQGRDVQIPAESQLNIRLDHQLSVPKSSNVRSTEMQPAPQ